MYPQVDLHLEQDTQGGYEPKSTWNGGQLVQRKVQSSIIVDTAAMDRIRESQEAAAEAKRLELEEQERIRREQEEEEQRMRLEQEEAERRAQVEAAAKAQREREE